ncbi:DUF1801 domain-containing protein [Kordia sp. YSTF-M3]|uniref:DUF1801 domain-containing protein n=1 Tax=Kordia aestuariivivens TaxID=2759037 RepID=A0ABR7QBR3_9FLAO|nr:DUF1801 domain-containing protein [Kordia aestuariivivens]MBC8756012.1 DUF1801 domain-containing protein [Kordia aestuariivivens]
MNPAEAYILKQPEPYKSILLQLQVVFEHLFPEIELKYKYRIPFYYLKGKPFCYLNASHKRQYVDVGIVKGNQILIHSEHLVTEKRKVMASLRYKTLEDIDNGVLIEVLKKAASLY